MSELDALLDELRQQEEEIQFSSFSNDTALQIGLAILEEARQGAKPVTIDITRHGQQIFHFAMAGTTRDNGEWIRRKINTVNRFGHSSYYMGIYLKRDGRSIEEKYMVSPQEYAAHGGAFPIIIKNVGVVGTVTVSGLPQQDDHALVVKTLRKFVE